MSESWAHWQPSVVRNLENSRLNEMKGFHPIRAGNLLIMRDYSQVFLIDVGLFFPYF